MDPTARLSRLRWLCRRGMKELDVMLEAFLAENATTLENGDLPELEAFLATEDDLLWDWLQKRRLPQQPEWRSLVFLIRREPL